MSIWLLRLRLLDPGRVQLGFALRTLVAAVAALLIAGAVSRAGGLPGGIVVIATVVAVLVSRSLHGTSLTHRLSALVYVPVIGVAAAFVGRFMVGHAVLGAAVFVAAVGASRYLMRFGGKVRSLGRLALTPLISVLVVPVPPSAAKATGPFWGGLAGLIAVACVIAVQTLVPARPTRTAAAAALDLLAAIRSPRTRPHILHRTALAVDDRLDAAVLPATAPDRAPLDALSAAVLTAEVLAMERASDTDRAPGAVGDPALDSALDGALADLRVRAAAVRGLASRARPTPEAPPVKRQGGGWRNVQPHTRLAAQLTAAMAVAFAVGHVVFPHRWMWPVITAFVVCSGARGRGDVVHKSGLRVAGAFAGAVTGTLAAHLVTGSPAAAITVIFGYLLAGLWLRERNYAVWAFCVTSVLSVLYSLNGEQGGALLVQRPEGILVGSACGIAAAYFVLPLHTERVMRARASSALRALQDLLGAVREPEPRPAAIRHLARQFDRAAQDLAQVAAPARAHRALFRVHGTVLFRRPAETPAPARARFRRRRAEAAAHAADWADSLAACAHAARVLAATEPAALVASRRLLGLTALNVGQVRRRLGHRPDAEPPRPAPGGPPHLLRLNAALAALYHQLPTPAPDSATAPAAAAASG